jgi:hypothetical protein
MKSFAAFFFESPEKAVAEVELYFRRRWDFNAAWQRQVAAWAQTEKDCRLAHSLGAMSFARPNVRPIDLKGRGSANSQTLWRRGRSLRVAGASLSKERQQVPTCLSSAGRTPETRLAFALPISSRGSQQDECVPRKVSAAVITSGK